MLASPGGMESTALFPLQPMRASSPPSHRSSPCARLFYLLRIPLLHPLLGPHHLISLRTTVLWLTHPFTLESAFTTPPAATVDCRFSQKVCVHEQSTSCLTRGTYGPQKKTLDRRSNIIADASRCLSCPSSQHKHSRKQPLSSTRSPTCPADSHGTALSCLQAWK